MTKEASIAKTYISIEYGQDIEYVEVVLRYMNRGVLQIFYRNGITVPFPNITISNIDPDHKPTIEDFKKDPSGEPEKK